MLVRAWWWPLGENARSGPGWLRFPVCTGRRPAGGAVTHIAPRRGGVLRHALPLLLHTCFVGCVASWWMCALDFSNGVGVRVCAVPIHTHTRTHTGSRVVSWGPDGAPRIALWGIGWATAHCVGVAAGRRVSLRGTGTRGGGALAPLRWSPLGHAGWEPRVQA